MTDAFLDWRETFARTGVAAGAAVLGAVIAVGAVTSPKLALAAVIGLGFVVVALQSLAAGVALFTVLTFFSRVPGGGALTGTKAAGAVLVLAWLLALSRERGAMPMLGRDRPLLAYALALLLGLSLLSQIWASDPHAALVGALRIGQGALFVFIVFSAIRTGRDLKLIVGAFIIGAMLTAIVGLAGATHAESTAQVGGDATRLEGGIGDPNELAALLVPAFVFAAFAVAAVANPLKRWLLTGSAVVFAFALFQTQSRGGLVALGVVALTVPFASGRLRTRAIALVLAAVGIGILYYGLIAPPQAVAHVTNFSTGGGTGRTDLWSVAWRMFGNHPVLGVGMGNFQFLEPSYALGSIDLRAVGLVVDTPKVAHNTYLQVLAELGVAGFVVFIATLLIPLLSAFAAARRFNRAGLSDLDALARAAAIAAIGMLAAFLFISAQYERHLWLMLGLLAALPTVIRNTTATPQGR